MSREERDTMFKQYPKRGWWDVEMSSTLSEEDTNRRKNRMVAGVAGMWIAAAAIPFAPVMVERLKRRVVKQEVEPVPVSSPITYTMGGEMTEEERMAALQRRVAERLA